MTIETGGPAFPKLSNFKYEGQGLTIRDYFAAAALQGMISTSGAPFLGPDHADIEFLTAEGAYKFADAMLAERSKS